MDFTHERSPSSTTSNHPEPIDRIFFRLKELHEVQDESRNQQCPISLDQNSTVGRDLAINTLSKFKPQTNILAQLQQQSRELLDPYQLLNSSRSNGTKVTQVEKELREINKNLMEDNRKLFAECMRLKRNCEEWEGSAFRKKGQVKSQTGVLKQLQNQKLRREIQQLKRENDRLSGRVQKWCSQLKKQQSVARNCQQLTRQITNLEKQNQRLMGKVWSLEHELQESESRQAAKSNQSCTPSNSTFESRKTEGQKDRMITNMRIVHESQVRKLKAVIEQLRKEMSQTDTRSNFSGTVSLRKK